MSSEILLNLKKMMEEFLKNKKEYNDIELPSYGYANVIFKSEKTHDGPAIKEFIEKEKEKEKQKNPLEDDTVIEGPEKAEETCESCQ